MRRCAVNYRVLMRGRRAYFVTDDDLFCPFMVMRQPEGGVRVYMPAFLNIDESLRNGHRPEVVRAAAWGDPAILELAPDRDWWWFESSFPDRGRVRVDIWKGAKLQPLGKMYIETAIVHVSGRLTP